MSIHPADSRSRRYASRVNRRRSASRRRARQYRATRLLLPRDRAASGSRASGFLVGAQPTATKSCTARMRCSVRRAAADPAARPRAVRAPRRSLLRRPRPPASRLPGCAAARALPVRVRARRRARRSAAGATRRGSSVARHRAPREPAAVERGWPPAPAQRWAEHLARRRRRPAHV